MTAIDNRDLTSAGSGDETLPYHPPLTQLPPRAHNVRAEHRILVVFTMPDGSPIHPQRISARFLQHTRAAGLPSIRLHDVRHSYATVIR